MKKLIATLMFALLTVSGCTTGGNTNPSSQPLPSASPLYKGPISFIDVDMQAQPFAKELTVDTVKPKVFVSHEKQQMKVTWELSKEMRNKFPKFSMIKVWLVDEAKGKKGSSDSDADETFGKNLLESITNANQDELPFAQTVGILTQPRDDEGKVLDESAPYEIALRPDYELTPYDKVMITLETNANIPDTNPRPGTPLWIGQVDASKSVKMEQVPSGLLVFYFDHEITSMKSTALAQKQKIQPESINAKIQQGRGILWLNLYFKDQYPLPEGTVMEAWLIDSDSKNTHNTKSGPAYNDQALTDKINKSPQAISMGRLLLQPNQVEGNYVYTAILDTKLPLSAFDSMHVTLETDGSTGNYDPRPGNELFFYELKETK